MFENISLWSLGILICLYFGAIFVAFPLGIMIKNMLKERERWRTQPALSRGKKPSWLGLFLVELSTLAGFFIFLFGGYFVIFLILFFLHIDNNWLTIPIVLFLMAFFWCYSAVIDTVVARRKMLKTGERPRHWLTDPQISKEIAGALMFAGVGIIALNLIPLIAKIQPLLWLIFQAAGGGGVLIVCGFLYYQLATLSQQPPEKEKETLPPEPLTRPDIR